MHQRARSPAADDPVAHAERPLPAAVGRASCWSWRSGTASRAARAEIAATLADGSAARLFAAAAEEDDGAAAQTLAALRAAVAHAGASRRCSTSRPRRPATSRGKAGKDDLGRLLDLTARLYRDAVALAAGAPELAVLRDTDGGAGGAQALAALGVDRLNRALAAIVNAQEALLANVNPTLAIERLLIALKRQERRAA